jgi:hypothetical protein
METTPSYPPISSRRDFPALPLMAACVVRISPLIGCGKGVG